MNIEINVNKNSVFHSVSINADNTTIDLGLLDRHERDQFAEVMLEAVYALGPIDYNYCADWMRERFAKLGITIEKEEKR